MSTEFSIHIGTHKTGTTALQSFLYANRELLLSQGIDYPTLGIDPEHGSPSHRQFAYFFRERKQHYPESFANELERGITQSPHCILSAEPFYYIDKVSYLEHMRRYFPQETNILITYRHPCQHIYSLYSEMLKNKMTRSFQEFVDDQTNTLRKHNSVFHYYDYDQNEAMWRRYFANTISVPYERRSQTSLAEHFFDVLGITANLENSVETNHHNMSVSKELSVVILSLNKLLESEIINKKKYKKLRRAMKENEALVVDSVQKYLVYDEAHIMDFFDAFQQRNDTKWGLFFDDANLASREKIPVGIDMPAKILYNRMVELLQPW